MRHRICSSIDATPRRKGSIGFQLHKLGGIEEIGLVIRNYAHPSSGFRVRTFRRTCGFFWRGGRVKSARTTGHDYHLKTPCVGLENPARFLRAEGAQEQQQNATTCDRT